MLTNVANPLLPNDADSEHDLSFLVSRNYVIRQRPLNEFRYLCSKEQTDRFTTPTTRRSWKPHIDKAVYERIRLCGSENYSLKVILR